MIRVYLDTSVYNRLYDDRSQLSIFLEMQATISILNLIETQKIEAIDSFVLEYENQKHPIPEQQNAINEYLKKSIFKQRVNELIKKRANQLELNGNYLELKDKLFEGETVDSLYEKIKAYQDEKLSQETLNQEDD